jgi:hypothetical protein
LASPLWNTPVQAATWAAAIALRRGRGARELPIGRERWLAA